MAQTRDTFSIVQCHVILNLWNVRKLAIHMFQSSSDPSLSTIPIRLMKWGFTGFRGDGVADLLSPFIGDSFLLLEYLLSTFLWPLPEIFRGYLLF